MTPVEVLQRFDAPPAAVLGALADPALYPRFASIPSVGEPEVLSIAANPDGGCTTKVRYRYRGDLPSAATAFVAKERLTWVEETTIEAGGAGRFRIVPDHYRDRVRFEGTVTVRAASSGAGTGSGSGSSSGGGGTERRLAGQLEVRLPLVARPLVRPAEAAIAEGIRAAWRDQVAVIERHLAGR